MYYKKEKILTDKVEEVEEKERMLYLKELEEKKKEKQKEDLKNAFQKNALEVMKNFKIQARIFKNSRPLFPSFSSFQNS